MTRFRSMLRPMWLVLMLSGAAPLLTACEDEGSLEEAGEAIDDAADEVGDDL